MLRVAGFIKQQKKSFYKDYEDFFTTALSSVNYPRKQGNSQKDSSENDA